jgi:hypothetical protein
MLKNLLDACGASFAYFAIGYAISFGGANPASPQKTFIGTKGFFLIDVDNYDLWIFNYAFCASAVTIVAGALAERCQMAAYFCYSLMLGKKETVVDADMYYTWSRLTYFTYERRMGLSCRRSCCVGSPGFSQSLQCGTIVGNWIFGFCWFRCCPHDR